VRARDSGDFGEMKCLFSIAPEVGKETEANAVTEVTGRCTGRDLSRDRRVRSVQRGRQARELGFATGASGDTRDRRVRSCEQRFTKSSDTVRVRSHTIGRVRSSRELTGLPPDAGTVASGRCAERVR
jgi:hypothetical protein